MSKHVWMITGAGRGLGADVARAALAAGHSVVASGRDRERVSRVLGTATDLLTVNDDQKCISMHGCAKANSPIIPMILFAIKVAKAAIAPDR